MNHLKKIFFVAALFAGLSHSFVAQAQEGNEEQFVREAQDIFENKVPEESKKTLPADIVEKMEKDLISTADARKKDLEASIAQFQSSQEAQTFLTENGSGMDRFNQLDMKGKAIVVSLFAAWKLKNDKGALSQMEKQIESANNMGPAEKKAFENKMERLTNLDFTKALKIVAS